MRLKQGWLIALLMTVLLIAACGSEKATQTKKPPPETEPASPTAVEPTSEPKEPAPPPLSEGDGLVLGSPDAPVTIVEYSDFQ